jgi:hypothetical protein
MKRIFLFAAILFSLTALAQTPVITFNKTTHDFGKINEADGRVTTVFVFKNEGMTPLVLSNVRASCGCTTPKWTREPIEPGATGDITVTYNPAGRPGRFQKTVTVTSNASESTTRLYIKGEVIPKPANPADQYPVKMGELNLKQKYFNFGVLSKKPGSKNGNIEYTNTTQSPITIQLETLAGDEYLKPLVTLPEIKPGETGKIQIAFNAMECPIWGPVETKLYVIVNGKRQITNEYAITLKADIREDFSQLTAEQRMQAPIIDVKLPELGTVKAGKKTSFKLAVTNAGINPMTVHRIFCTDESVTVALPKHAIKGGKKADLNMVINSIGLESGNYSRTLTFITNDPNKSIYRVTVTWNVE